jgi:Ser/Thr protein kinase RdoA (MazF antagonist)
LRRWPPESPDESRLSWLQAVVAHAAARDFRLLPTVIATSRGAAYRRHDGHLWELTTWMPGKADYCSDSRPEKLAAAAAALAQFHDAVKSFDWPSDDTANTVLRLSHRPTHAVSPGIDERLALVRRLRANAFSKLKAAVRRNRGIMPAVADGAEELLELVSPQLMALEHDLNCASRIEVPLQTCLRDIWHDHVLFEGNQVSGIVDVGSMRQDTVATDIARLLGSLCGNDRDGWTAGLSAYGTIRTLLEPERTLIGIFDRSQMVLAGVNWVEWVFVKCRTFSDPAAVGNRMEHILSRLRESCL